MNTRIDRFYFKLTDPAGKLRTFYAKTAAYSLMQAQGIIRAKFPAMTLFLVDPLQVDPATEFRSIK